MSFLLMLLPLLCAACSDAGSSQSGLASRSEVSGSPPTADNLPREYVTDAQRARAYYYWLPQNQLPPDAGVEHPIPGGAAAVGE